MSSKLKEEPPSGGRGSRRAREWRGEPLPRGRHKLAAGTVRASQRERLIRAMLETVARLGYEATTVPEVVATARVSRNSFYEFFSDKTDCFIAACDEQATELLRLVVASGGETDWIETMRLGVRSYLGWWASRPAFSRAYFTGLPAAGERAIEQRERAYELFAQMFAEVGRRARAQQPSLPSLPDRVPMMLVLAITELVAAEVRGGRTERLPELERDLVFVAVKLLADDDTARRALG
ncbi:MAG TPA: TetR/AcrR family transcriptional regulator [Solirubrobacteraceae bacterium]|nr:TetR/AcrR family transcriptional regulator [Solirubrobacteraceae bacterium]